MVTSGSSSRIVRVFWNDRTWPPVVYLTTSAGQELLQIIWFGGRTSVQNSVKKNLWKHQYVNAFQRIIAVQMSRNFPQECILSKDAMPGIKVKQLYFPLLTHSTFSFSEVVLASCCRLLCAPCLNIFWGRPRRTKLLKKKIEVLWDNLKWIIIKQFCLTTF